MICAIIRTYAYSKMYAAPLLEQSEKYERINLVGYVYKERACFFPAGYCDYINLSLDKLFAPMS